MHMSSDSVHNKETYVLCKQFSFEWMAVDTDREIMLMWDALVTSKCAYSSKGGCKNHTWCHSSFLLLLYKRDKYHVDKIEVNVCSQNRHACVALSTCHRLLYCGKILSGII